MNNVRHEYEQGKTISIQVGEHTFITPPMPAKKEFLFHDLPTKDQYWRRQTDFPKIFFEWHREGDGVELDAEYTRHNDAGLLAALSVQDSILLFGDPKDGEPEGLQFREFRRRAEGVWFFNNGEPTYITGHHYFILQWGAMLGVTNDVEIGSQYGQYYQFQRDMGYFYEIAKTTKYGVGGVFMKPKKTGATQFFSLIALNEASTRPQVNVRIMSITEALAKDSNFGYIKYAVSKMPDIMLSSRAKENEGEIKFGPPNSSRSPLSKKKRKVDVEYLNSWLCTVPTGRTSFDSMTNYLALIDEFPKIKESTYPQELLEATLPTVMEGFIRRKGTILMLSYSPEKTDKSFRQSKEIYYNSKLKTIPIDPNTGKRDGQTASGLIAHTLTIQEGIFGGCDMYGKPIEDMVWKIYNSDLEKASKKENPTAAIQTAKRQYPTSEADPWNEGAIEDSIFDLERISRRINEIKEEYSIGVRNYKQFSLRYEKAPKKRDIGTEYDFPGRIMMDITTDADIRAQKPGGKWKMYRPEWLPAQFMDKYINKRFVHPKTGLLMPDPNSPFLLSMDPSNYKESRYTKTRSLNAIMAFMLPNSELDAMVGVACSNRRLFMEYLFREDNPKDTLQEIIQIILFLNCPILLEANIPTWSQKLIEVGLGHFLLMVDSETKAVVPWQKYGKQIFYSLQTNNLHIDLCFDAAKMHLAVPKMDDEVDNIQHLDSVTVLTQLGQIKPDETTRYDAAVAYMEGLYAINHVLGYRKTMQDRKVRLGDTNIRTAAGILR
jgi:hypothetical protein